MPERESEPLEKNPVGKKAAAHPEFTKWMQAAGEADRSNPDDALEHAEDPTDSSLYLAARAYWFRRSIGADAGGFGYIGEHLKKPQELAARFKVTRQEAEDVVNQAQVDVTAAFEEWSRKGLDHASMKLKAQKEINQLERRLEHLDIAA